MTSEIKSGCVYVSHKDFIAVPAGTPLIAVAVCEIHPDLYEFRADLPVDEGCEPLYAFFEAGEVALVQEG